jgi:hypothetical protein
MGATHKETVTELVKGMIQANHIKADPGSKHPARDVLKKAILLVEYGVQYYRDPKNTEQVKRAMQKESTEKKQSLKSEPRIINDLNTLKKKPPQKR